MGNRMSEYYILEDGKPKPVSDVLEWSQWYEANREGHIVAQTELSGARISTVFLGLDRSFGEGPPLIYETLVFDGPHDMEMDRCSTPEQAVAMHQKMVKKVRGGNEE